MPILWGRWYSEEEAQQMARELNQIGRNIEKKTEGVAMWVRDVQKRQSKDPHGRAF